VVTVLPDSLTLRRSHLRQLPPSVSVPSYHASDLVPSVVHLGVGAFHRAHQAVYLDRLAESGERGWGLVGSGLRSGRIGASLLPQDGLYTVVEQGPGARRPRVVGVMQRYLGCSGGHAQLLEALSDQRTQLVTMTVTAPAYAEAPQLLWRGTAFDYLVGALARRRRAGLGGFTVLACDNMTDNGAAARAAVLRLAQLRDPALARWIDTHVTFPTSMVDRITPAGDVRLRRELRLRHGYSDRCPIATEPFAQWVVEDEFAAARPPLDDVGVTFVTDARPYLTAKTSLLNASHCALGYLGSRLGHVTSAEAVRDPRVRPLVLRMMTDEVAPHLGEVPGLDLASYQRVLLGRFENEAMSDPLHRLRLKGSVRIAHYVAPSLRRAISRGTPYDVLALVLAAWIDHLRRHDGPLTDLADPRGSVLRALAHANGDDPRAVLAAVPELRDLVASTQLMELLGGYLTDLRTRDVACVLASALTGRAGAVAEHRSLMSGGLAARGLTAAHRS
jgi:mannitol 2-dehydrogenase